MRTGIGLDFGTTNSSIAIAHEDRSSEAIFFQAGAGKTNTYRSVLYFESARINRADRALSCGGRKGPAYPIAEVLSRKPAVHFDQCIRPPIYARRPHYHHPAGPASSGRNAAWEKRFGARKISSGSEFTSVARGLALRALESSDISYSELM